jgi:signal transduction histidine kinase
MRWGLPMIGSSLISGRRRSRTPGGSTDGVEERWGMKVPLPLLFMLLMTLVIMSFYDVLQQSRTVHREANRRVAKAVLEATLTRAQTGLNDIASRVAREADPLDADRPVVVAKNDAADIEDLSSRTLFLGFDSEHRIFRARVGHDMLSPADLRSLAAQPAIGRIFRHSATSRLPDALLVAVNDVPFILSDPQPRTPANPTDRSAFLVVGLPASTMVFDELKKYEVFGDGALKTYLNSKNQFSGLADLIVSLQNREYAKFHFSAVAQIVVLLVAFIIAVMIGRHVDIKNDALRTSRDTIAEREHEAQHLRQLAEAASEAKSRFIHNMSHELRTPLNAILGYAELITNETFGVLQGPLGRYKESASSIHRGGLRLLSSISEVLEYSALIDADRDLREENLDLAALLNDVATAFKDRADDQNITLEVPESPPLPSLRADREMMRSLFGQLISNAINYSEGGGEVTITPGLTASGRLQVAIRDQGTGMDPVQQSQAFEPFYQGEDVFARQHQGMGLGLSLAKAYADYHGAKIKIRSAVGEGTTVTVIFSSDRSIVGVAHDNRAA